MATQKKGVLTRSRPQWWRHLRRWKRTFWKGERQTVQRTVREVVDGPDWDRPTPAEEDPPASRQANLQRATRLRERAAEARDVASLIERTDLRIRLLDAAQAWERKAEELDPVLAESLSDVAKRDLGT